MFKVFGVGDGAVVPPTSKKQHSNEGHHDPHQEDADTRTEGHSHAIEVDIRDNHHDHDTDIGQIAVDILDTPNAIIIVAPIAGVDPAEVDIGLSRNILTLSGERHEAPIYLEAKRLLVEECFYGAFSRSIILPENLAFDKIRARIEHNVLFIEIPKLTLISRSIKINQD